MRFFLAPLLSVFLSFSAYSAENSAAESKIKSVLTKPKSWTLYWEFTDALTPGERAAKLIWEYFERDGKLIGRHVMAFGGCEQEVSVQADVIRFRYCDERLGGGERSLRYDPADSKYPFKSDRKSQNPNRLWLQAND